MAQAPRSKKEDESFEFGNVATALAGLFGKQKKVTSEELAHTDSMSASGGDFNQNNPFDEWDKSLGGTDKKILRELPRHRNQKYAIYDRMCMDPIIYACLKLHANTALSYDEENAEIVTVKYVGDEKDKAAQEMVEDLGQLMERLQITERLFTWGLDVLKYGMWSVRVYGERGKGVTNVISNALTHPYTLKIYERSGKLAGFTSMYQVSNGEEYELMAPWSFITFRMQGHTDDPTTSLSSTENRNQWNIGADAPSEALVESWNYGRSILEGCFLPWLDLQESVIALNMSRRNKSKRDRMIGFPVGGQAPARAAALTQAIAQRLKQRKLLDEEKRQAGGYVASQEDFLLPYDSQTGNGKLEFSTIEPNADVSAIEDVMFHVKRVAGSLGLDPALIGFGDMLAGGLGEGGWFRQSILAAATGEQLRRSISIGLNRMFEIHLAYKYKTAYPPNKRPWELQFHAASSAKEIEENQSKLLKMDLTDRLNQTVQAFREAGVGIDATKFAKYSIHHVLGMDEGEWEELWDKKAPPAAEGSAEAFATGGGGGNEGQSQKPPQAGPEAVNRAAREEDD